MRGAFKRSTALKRCTRAHSEVCTRTLHHPRASAESVARSTNSNAAACSLSTPRGAGLSPCTERHSAGHAKQRAAGPRWPEEPLAQLSWASPRTAGAVASRHLRPGMSVGRPSLSVKMLPHVCRAAARRFSTSGFSSQRRGSGHHTPVVAVPVCDYWQCMVVRRSFRPGGVPKQSRHPALLDLGALLLRQHRGALPAGGSEKHAIAKMTPAPALAPKF